jgi:hypothetical protein
MTTENPDSLITVKNSLIAQSNSPFNAQKFPVRIPREFSRKSLWQLAYFLLFSGLARPDDENSLYFIWLQETGFARDCLLPARPARAANWANNGRVRH